MNKPEFEYVPIEFYGKAGYDSSGKLTYVEVLCSGRQPTVVAHPEPGETVGEVFERAFEGAKTLLVTQRFAWSDDPPTTQPIEGKP